jgi:glycosyltransferase involved in cell wall biosynthesis
MTIAVAQLGARMHYGVPRIFYQAGMLERFFTDLSAPPAWIRYLERVPHRLRVAHLQRFLGRSLPVPEAKVTVFPGLGLSYALRRRLAPTLSHTTGAHLWAGRTLCARVLRTGLGKATAVYTFNSAGLELLRAARERGLHAIMEQTIAPHECETRLLGQERSAHPDWEPPSSYDGRRCEFIQRERNEWKAADLIVCGSDFVRNAIGELGGPLERCVVVPYGVDTPRVTRSRRSAGPLRVLMVGAVGLRKGAPYLLAAARLLSQHVVVRAVGPIQVSPTAQRDLQSAIELTGPVPRSEILAHYRWADVFVLPSICEGSATVCYEALAAGLPVVTTPNAGSVVREGVDGFIVPIRCPETIAERLDRLAADPGLLAEMSRNALRRAAEFTVEEYGRRLLSALAKCLPPQQANYGLPPQQANSRRAGDPGLVRNPFGSTN